MLYPFQQQLLKDIATGGFKRGEMMIISSGRQTGKSMLNAMYGKIMAKHHPTKIQWTRHDKHPLSLVATSLDDSISYINFLTEDDMLEVAAWCKECNCGTRTSFDTIRFKNEKQITMFLMKWPS